LAEHCGEGFIEVGVAGGEDALVAELMEQHFGQFRFAAVDERVQQRIFEPAERGVSLDAVYIDIEAFLCETVTASARRFLREVAAIYEAADERIPPGFRF